MIGEDIYIMNNNVVKLIAFASGTAVGSVATWLYLKNYYDKIHQEEIAALKEKYEGTAKSEPEKDEETVALDIKPDGIGVAYPEFEQGTIDEYERLAAAYSGQEEYEERPYVIPPDEFGEKDFTEVSLTLYSDGIVTDEDDRPLEDIENTIGKDSLNHFGEYEDDSVHVRNERLRCDFEILLDQRTYDEVLGKKPYIQPFDEDEED